MIKEGMQLVRDEFVFSKECYESTNNNKKGVLRTIKGPVAEWGNVNRNNRKYSEKLWDNVLNSDYVKEQTENKCLYGEANHPEGRFEVDFARVSHNMAEMHKVPDKGQIYATIDILDTPLGNILNVLYEYGSVIGFSSRAGGVLHNKKNFVEVDEESFHFITFDAVPYPSVKSARPLHESGNVDEIDRVDISEEAHNKIVQIIEESGKKDKEVLKAFIYSLQDYNLDKEISILEGLSDNKDTDEDLNESLKNTTLCLLKESYRQLSTLKTEKNNIERNLDESSKKVNEYKDKICVALKKIKTLNEESQSSVSKIEETNNMNIELKNKVDDLSLKNNALLDTIRVYENSLEENELKNDEIQVLKNDIEKINKALDDKIVENVELKKKLNEIEENISSISIENEKLKKVSDYDEIVVELGKVVKEYSAIKENFDMNSNELEKTRSNLNIALSDVDRAINENALLVTEIKDSKVKYNSLNEQVSQLNQKISEITNISESYKKKINDYKEDLVKSICGKYDINPNKIYSTLNEDFTSEDVYNLCESFSEGKDKLELVSISQEILNESNENVEANKKKERLNDLFEKSNRRGKILN